MADLAESVLSTSYYHIQLDNTSPEADISMDAGRECSDFTVGEKVHGRFVARDRDFGSYSLSTKPASRRPNAPVPAGGNTPTTVTPGDAWVLDTTGMDPCGYVVELQVVDRTIRNSTPGHHNAGYADVGFCLK